MIDKLPGKVTIVTITNVSTQVLGPSRNRVKILFFPHNANRYFISPENVASSTGSINVSVAVSPLEFTGSLAKAAWQIVDAAAGPDNIAVVEYFDLDNEDNAYGK